VDPLNHLLIGGFGFSYLPIFLIVGSIGNVLWFYWIDVSLLAGRRSDPMLRDTFRWRKTRKIAWPLLFVFLAIPVVLTSYYALVQDWAFLQKIFSIAGSLSAPGNLYINSYAWVFFAFTAAALVLTGRRSGDRRIQRQLEWFGAFVLISILVSAAGQTTLFGQGTLAALLLGTSLLVQSFFIYKAARSLVPTNRIEKIEVP
jgi:hypothetical protein